MKNLDLEIVLHLLKFQQKYKVWYSKILVALCSKIKHAAKFNNNEGKPTFLSTLAAIRTLNTKRNVTDLF